MADQLFLNLWFPSFAEKDMLHRMHSVFKLFPFSAARPGIGYVGVHPVSWSEPLLLAHSFDYQAEPAHALEMAGEFLHSDYAFEFEALWDLWTAETEGGLDEKWVLSPQPVKFTAHGLDFEGGIYQADGHIQINFGVDAPFLHEEMEFTQAIEARIKANVQKLIAFTQAIEMNCGITGRVLWSESDENLAQKLIAKLQRVQ